MCILFLCFFLVYISESPSLLSFCFILISISFVYSCFLCSSLIVGLLVRFIQSPIWHFIHKMLIIRIWEIVSLATYMPHTTIFWSKTGDRFWNAIRQIRYICFRSRLHAQQPTHTSKRAYDWQSTTNQKLVMHNINSSSFFYYFSDLLVNVGALAPVLLGVENA